MSPQPSFSKSPDLRKIVQKQVEGTWSSSKGLNIQKWTFFGHPVHDSLNELQKPIDVNYLESTCAKARFDRLEQKDWCDFTLGDLTI